MFQMIIYNVYHFNFWTFKDKSFLNSYNIKCKSLAEQIVHISLKKKNTDFFLLSCITYSNDSFSSNQKVHRSLSYFLIIFRKVFVVTILWFTPYCNHCNLLSFVILKTILRIIFHSLCHILNCSSHFFVQLVYLFLFLYTLYLWYLLKLHDTRNNCRILNFTKMFIWKSHLINNKLFESKKNSIINLLDTKFGSYVCPTIATV